MANPCKRDPWDGQNSLTIFTSSIDRMGSKEGIINVVEVPPGNGITRYEQGAYSLVGGVAEGFCGAVELRDAERDELLQLCRQRLDAIRERQKGMATTLI